MNIKTKSFKELFVFYSVIFSNNHCALRHLYLSKKKKRNTHSETYYKCLEIKHVKDEGLLVQSESVYCSFFFLRQV